MRDYIPLTCQLTNWKPYTPQCVKMLLYITWNKPVSFLNVVKANNSGYGHTPINQTHYQKWFKCELCDLSFKFERSFNNHITRKHTKINQLDGNVSLIEPAKEQDWKDVKRKKKKTKKNNKSEPAVKWMNQCHKL